GADPAGAAVHRQRRDDRLVRRASDRGRCAAVAVGRGERSGSARSEGTSAMNEDKLAITELLYRYAELIDAGDFDGVGQLLSRATFAGTRSASTSGSEAIAKLFAMTTRRYPDS